MIYFCVGSPGWKMAARLGIPLCIKVSVLWDDQAKVFVAQSDDFLPEFGCVAESPTWDGLKNELQCVFDDAFDVIFGSKVKQPVIRSYLCFA